MRTHALTLALLLTLVIPIAARADDEPPARGIAIHLVATGGQPDFQAPNRPLDELTLEPEPLIGPADIIAYHPERAALELTPQARQRLIDGGLQKKVGHAFVLTADGEPIFAGQFLSNVVSSIRDHPVIIVDEIEKELVIDRTYHGTPRGPDPRADARLPLADHRARAERRLRARLASLVEGYGADAGADYRTLSADELIDASRNAPTPPLRQAALAALALDHVTVGKPRLVEVVADDKQSPYHRHTAALGLALASDPVAKPLLRRVLNERAFAATASGFEYGEAALGLALLGDAASRDPIEKHATEGGNERADAKAALEVLKAQKKADSPGD